MITRKQHKALTGFTLVELLVAMTVFSVIAISIYQTIRLGVKTWERNNLLIRQNHGVRVFFDNVSQDLVNAVSLPPLKAETEAWGPDNMLFQTVRNIYIDKRASTELAGISYRFDKAGGALFQAHAGIEDGFDVKGVREKIVLKRVKDVHFEYADALPENGTGMINWQDEWKRNGKRKLPRAVKINVALDAAKGTGGIEKIIFIPQARAME